MSNFNADDLEMSMYFVQDMREEFTKCGRGDMRYKAISVCDFAEDVLIAYKKMRDAYTVGEEMLVAPETKGPLIVETGAGAVAVLHDLEEGADDGFNDNEPPL